MNLEQLKRLIAKGESDRHEFKKSTGELKGGMESLCGFLNGLGGKLFFGVTKGGRMEGQDISDSTLQEVSREILRLEPSTTISQMRLPVQGTREVLILETTDRSLAPYTYNGRPYQRIGTTTSL